METLIIILIAIFATVGVYSIGKMLNNRIEIFRDQRKIKRKRIADVDILNNQVITIFKRIDEIFGNEKKVKARLQAVEKIANNFDRDMDRYHERISVENQSFNDRLVKAEKLKKALESAFKRICKLEDANKNCYDTHLLHAHMISALEKLEGKKRPIKLTKPVRTNLSKDQQYFVNMILAAISTDKDMLDFVIKPATGTSHAVKLLEVLLGRKNPTELITD